MPPPTVADAAASAAAQSLPRLPKSRLAQSCWRAWSRAWSSPLSSPTSICIPLSWLDGELPDQHLDLAHGDDSGAREIQRNGAVLPNPGPGHPPVRGCPHGVGALPGVGVAAIRARPLAERIRVRRPPLGAGDCAAVTHRPNHTLDLR